MKMYNIKPNRPTSLHVNESVEGESIEVKVERIVNNKEPITDGAPIVFTERKDGVRPEYDVRTDRWEVALDAMDAVARTHQAKREERIKEKGKVIDLNSGENKPKNGGAESTQGN